MANFLTGAHAKLDIVEREGNATADPGVRDLQPEAGATPPQPPQPPPGAVRDGADPAAALAAVEGRPATPTG